MDVSHTDGQVELRTELLVVFARLTCWKHRLG